MVCNLASCEGFQSKQLYWPETGVLITRFLCASGVVESVDFVAVSGGAGGLDRNLLIRMVTGLSGEMPLCVVCQPAFNYGRDMHETIVMPRGTCFHAATQSLGVATDVPLRQEGTGVTGDFASTEGQKAVFVLQQIEHGQGCELPFSAKQATECFKGTTEYWRR